jgi:glutamate formiminotransferase/formiminotetrahydrofolate cyclodeaminase
VAVDASDWLDEPLGRFVGRIADETPAPGGGSTAAIVVAMAAALVEMAARFSAAWDGAAQAATRAQALRERALPMARRDAEGYEAVLRATRRGADVDAALAEASAVPLELAQAGAEVAELGALVTADGKRSVRGDAAAGAVLGAAVASVAANLVAINLARTPGDERTARAAALAASAAAAAERAVATSVGGER